MQAVVVGGGAVGGSDDGGCVGGCCFYTVDGTCNRFHRHRHFDECHDECHDDHNRLLKISFVPNGILVHSWINVDDFFELFLRLFEGRDLCLIGVDAVR